MAQIPVKIKFAFNEHVFCFINNKDEFLKIKEQLSNSCIPELVYIELLKKKKIIPIQENEIKNMSYENIAEIDAVKNYSPAELMKCLNKNIKKYK